MIKQKKVANSRKAKLQQPERVILLSETENNTPNDTLHITFVDDSNIDDFIVLDSTLDILSYFNLA